MVLPECSCHLSLCTCRNVVHLWLIVWNVQMFCNVKFTTKAMRYILLLTSFSLYSYCFPSNLPPLIHMFRYAVAWVHHLFTCAVCWSAGNDPNVRVAVLLGSMLGWCTKLSNCHCCYAKDCQCVPVHSAMLSLLSSLTHHFRLEMRVVSSSCGAGVVYQVLRIMEWYMSATSTFPTVSQATLCLLILPICYIHSYYHMYFCRVEGWDSSDRMSWGDDVCFECLPEN